MFSKETAVVAVIFMLVFATIPLASFAVMVFLRQQLLFIFIAFLSTCVGIYVAWDMNLTWHKFYTYLISEKLFFNSFNYAVIQLFFIVVGRKYAAIF